MCRIYLILTLLLFHLVNIATSQELISNSLILISPMDIDSVFLINLQNTHNEKDSLSICNSFEENYELAPGVFNYSVYRFYNIGLFELDNNCKVLLYGKVGGAGGYETRVFMRFVNIKTGSVLLGKIVGDCSFLNIKESYFQDSIIVMTDKKFINNCEQVEYNLKNFKKENIIVNKLCLGR